MADPQMEGVRQMREEIDRLKAVVEILADAVQALTAVRERTPSSRH
jgi:hypothetical protein